MPLVQSQEIDYLFLEDTILLIFVLMILISLKWEISNGLNLLTKNLVSNQKMQNPKLELLNPELIILLISIKD